MNATPTQQTHQPLANRMRPKTMSEFFGQAHLTNEGKPLRQTIERGQLHSMILWGPPGTGKTTLANIIANASQANIIKLSAVMSGVKDIRQAIEKAQIAKREEGRDTILFIDEVHRFNKSQQDAFLPFVEDGTVTLIGATTENPSFELNSALLSRARVYVLKPLGTSELREIIRQALTEPTRGYGSQSIDFSDDSQERLAIAADGDARRCLNYLEIAIAMAAADGERLIITDDILEEVLTGSMRRFDKGGDVFYDQISALHKSVRGSSPDGALYWYARMLDGGCDPLYIARRVVRIASEDIGNADPRGLEIALNAWQTFERLGSPEGELAIAQAIVYLAVCAKSNAVYNAFKAAMSDVKQHGSCEVPMHLRNAPTKLMKQLGHGKGYRYAHDEANAYAAGETYFPDELGEPQYYYPVDRGLELKIKNKLAALRKETNHAK